MSEPDATREESAGVEADATGEPSEDSAGAGVDAVVNGGEVEVDGSGSEVGGSEVGGGGIESDADGVDADVGVPELGDEYLRRVARRLRYSYDLEADHRAGRERFDLYGLLAVENQRQFLHRSINWANHESREHVFVRRSSTVSPDELDRLVETGHAIADDRIEADETHQVTEFTFVTVTPEIPDDVRSYVDGFRDRTLLRFGYYGHYEVNLAVVSPDREDAVASELAAVVEAFTLWEDGTSAERGSSTEPRGTLSRVANWLRNRN
ncbi:hypothetical protein ACFQAS_03370 [Halopenitus salinus]|uniref:DUF8052 domain-containing protein n=1 Tax=Halopenitus salinus TaxID=1198295 RepID=A0ABD5UQG8_9EURY